MIINKSQVEKQKLKTEEKEALIDEPTFFGNQDYLEGGGGREEEDYFFHAKNFLKKERKWMRYRSTCFSYSKTKVSRSQMVMKENTVHRFQLRKLKVYIYIHIYIYIYI
jgi:hypothetical protein